VNTKGLTSLAESQEVERCTELLAAAPLDVIIFGGTSASFIKGLDWDRAMIERMEKFSNGIPVTTTSTASIKALQQQNVRRVAIATPYIDEVNERAHDFFTANGFEVVNLKGLGIDDDHRIGYTSLETVYRLVKGLDLTNADGVFISCTNLQTIGVLESLEQDIGKPAVSAIQASFWECLRLAGLKDARIRGFGSLLEKGEL
jgi:maleate isomerase